MRPESEFTCFFPGCTKQFKISTGLRRHCIEEHPTCLDTCRKFGIRKDGNSITASERKLMLTMEETSLIQTYKVPDSKKTVPCFIPDCNLMFVNASQLRRHAVLDHSDKPMTYSMYGRRRSKKRINAEEKTRMQLMSVEDLEYEYCLQDLKKEGKNNKCFISFCGRNFNQPSAMKNHALTEHREEIKTWLMYAVPINSSDEKCIEKMKKLPLDELKAQFTLPMSMYRRRMKSIRGQIPHKCFVKGCNKIYVNKSGLRTHALQFHRNNVDTWRRYCIIKKDQKNKQRNVTPAHRTLLEKCDLAALKKKYILPFCKFKGSCKKPDGVFECFVKNCTATFPKRDYLRRHAITQHEDCKETWIRFALRKDRKRIPPRLRERLREFSFKKIMELFVLQQRFDNLSCPSRPCPTGPSQQNHSAIVPIKYCLKCLLRCRNKLIVALEKFTSNHDKCSSGNLFHCAMTECDLSFPRQSEMYYHLHKTHGTAIVNELAKQTNSLFSVDVKVCEECNVGYLSQEKYNNHLTTAEHITKNCA